MSLRRGLRPAIALLACAAMAGPAVLAATPTAAESAVTAAASPLSDPFYTYTGSQPLADVARGTVLKTRTVSYHVQGIPTPITATQLQYRTEDMLGNPAVGVTSVLHPLAADQQGKPARVVSYQSFYDSLNPADEPSAAIAGGSGLGDGLANAETLLIAPLLLAGYTVNIPDTEGQNADFAAGPEYGKVTLDSLTAISQSAEVGVGTTAPIGLMGYSGGAIGTEWAAELAPTYTPAISGRVVGSSMGGVLVDPAHNLHYVNGSTTWAGVMAMAMVGISRANHVDLTPYASDYGKQVMATMQTASIATVLAEYPGLTWQKMMQPQWAVPESLPVYVQMVNQLIMGSAGTPAAPLEITQGTGGYLEGTSGTQPGIGAGDGVMIAGDVRTLARDYCQRGIAVAYDQTALSHVTTAPSWITDALPWMEQRFAGQTAPSSCGSIPPGNALDPVTPQS